MKDRFDDPSHYEQTLYHLAPTYDRWQSSMEVDEGRKEGNVLFNDTLNTFYLLLSGVRHMVKDHSDSKRGNLLPPHGLLFLVSSKGSFKCIITQTG